MAAGKSRGAVEAHGQAALKVGGEQEWILRISLQAVGERCGFKRLALEQCSGIGEDGYAEASDVILAHLLAEHEIVGIVARS